jgi:hypothetical protein
MRGPLPTPAPRGLPPEALGRDLEPVGHVAYSHLLFQVSPEALRRVTDPLPPDHGDKVN